MRSIAFVMAAVLAMAGTGIHGLEWHGGVIDTIFSFMLESNEVG